MAFLFPTRRGFFIFSHKQFQKRCISSMIPIEVKSGNDSIVKSTIPVGGKGLAISQYAQVDRSFSADDVLKYGVLVGDMNPLHQELNLEEKDLIEIPDIDSHPLLRLNEDGKTSKVVVHGMLVASLFSCMLGSLIPGAIYLNQSLSFKSAVYADDLVTAKVIITKIRKMPSRSVDKGVVVNADTVVTSNKKECIAGTATVWLPTGREL